MLLINYGIFWGGGGGALKDYIVSQEGGGEVKTGQKRFA